MEKRWETRDIFGEWRWGSDMQCFSCLLYTSEHGDEHDSHRNTDNQNRMGQIQDADKQRVFNSVFHIVLKPCHIGEDIGKQQEVKGYHNAYQNAEDVPVSYTHLDVYKRQVLHSRSEELLS